MKALAAILLVAAVALVAASELSAEQAVFSEFKMRRNRNRGVVNSDSNSDSNSDADVEGEKKSKGGVLGIDISGATCDGSEWVSSQQFPCFKNKGASHAIVESHNGGLGNTNAIKHCTAAAHTAGYARVDLYSFWCPNCGGNNPPKTAMANHIKWLKNQGVSYDTIWVDVETCSGCWNSAAANVAYLRDLVEGAASAGAKVGIYTNANEWAAVCGSDSSFSKFPLWYAHYDNSESFSDFAAFGGWTKPFMKQFNDQSTVGCFSGVDMDWRP